MTKSVYVESGGGQEAAPSAEGETAAGSGEKDEDEMTEEERIAQLGKPKLGDLVNINVHIRESIEFKVCQIYSYNSQVSQVPPYYAAVRLELLNPGA